METIMSTMTRPRAAAIELAQADPGRRLGAVLKRWWVAGMERRLESFAARQLHAMSDRELRDIGIARSQIEFVVQGARERDRVLFHF
jgi:uncharacterized protein YjiS (DUF1127 family)